MLVRQLDGRMKDVRVLDVTKENYIVPANERGIYHCAIEIVDFDKKTGTRLSKPRIQKFKKKEFETIVRRNLELQGYTITVLYDPTEYLEKAKQMQTAMRQPQQVDVNKAVAEALAKQKAENEKAIAKAVAEALAKQSAETKKGKK